MPSISKFLGIIIKMNPKEREHNPPHVHVYTSSFVAWVRISDGSIIHGKIADNKKKLVEEYIRMYKNELLEMWETEKIHTIDY